MVCKDSNGKEELTGIISWGNGCANRHPGIYTNVYRHLRWIKAPGNARINIEQEGDPRSVGQSILYASPILRSGSFLLLILLILINNNTD